MRVPILVDIKTIIMVERGMALNVRTRRSFDDWRQRAWTNNLLQWNTVIVSTVVSTILSDRIKSRGPARTGGDFCKTFDVSHLARIRIVGRSRHRENEL